MGSFFPLPKPQYSRRGVGPDLSINVLPLRTCSWVWSAHPFFLFSLGLSLLMSYVCLFSLCTYYLCSIYSLREAWLIVLNRRNDLRLQRQCIMNYLFSQRKNIAFDIPILYLVVIWLWETKKSTRLWCIMKSEPFSSRCFKSFFHWVVEWEDDLSFVTNNVFTAQWFLDESGKLI